MTQLNSQIKWYLNLILMKMFWIRFPKRPQLKPIQKIFPVQLILRSILQSFFTS